MQSYLSVIRPFMEPRKQLRKCYNLDFSVPAYSRILINMFKAVTDVSKLVLFLEEIKCY